MTSPHLRPIPVLALLAVLALPAAGFCPDLWDSAESCVCGVGDDLADLVACDVKKVARRAAKACDAYSVARDCAESEDGRAYFKALKKATKRLRRTLKVAERKGIATESLREGAEALRVATRKMIEDGIRTLKDRPDFETNDHVVRAAAMAEVCMDTACDALSGRKPFVTSMAEYRKAYLGMEEFL